MNEGEVSETGTGENIENKSPLGRLTGSKRGFIVTLFVATLFVFFFVLKSDSLKESIGVISLLSVPLFAGALLSQIISFLGSGLLVKDTIKLLGTDLPIGRATLYFVAASSMGITAGGTVAFAATMYYFMRRYGLKPESAFASGLVPDLANFLSVLLLSSVGIFYLFTGNVLTKEILTLLIICFTTLTVIFLMVIWFTFYPRLLKAFLTVVIHSLSKIIRKPVQEEVIEEKLTQVVRAFRYFRGGWKTLIRGEAINVVGDLVTLYLLFLALQTPVSVGILLAGYGLPLVIGKVIPGGVGINEALMVGVYTLFGVSTEAALIIVLAYRLVSFWLPLGAGFVALTYFRHKEQSA